MNPEGQFKASLGFAAFIAFAWLCLQLLLDPIRYYFLADFTAAFARIFFPLFIILLVVCLAAQRWTAFRQEDRGADFAAGASSKYARAVSILPAPLALLSGLTAFFIRYVIFRSDYLYLGYIPRILMAYAGLIIAGFVAIKALRHRRWELGFLLVLALTSALLRLGFASHLATQNYFHPGPRGGKSGPPPIILITIDTLRRDSLSCYDQAVQYTPNIGELAKESAVFERHYTVAPWTLPSLASLMTGLPPQTHQAVTHGSRLADGFTTLAEHLRGAGYLTAAFVDSICL
ncbi:sulfatase-like hydrolase/transferase, partial [Candidatus Sumerlaeota bacterium]|nr:sulfatase-like hydrolase/transferase [Candidatus Sumerlaeota bacterium]